MTDRWSVEQACSQDVPEASLTGLTVSLELVWRFSCEGGESKNLEKQVDERT